MRIYANIFFFLFLILNFKNESLAQLTASDAKSFFSAGNYKAALPIYLELLKKEPQNTDFNYKAGVCFLNTNVDKTKAVTHLEFTVENDKQNTEALYELARAYHLGHRFDEAIKMYLQYKEKIPEKNQFKVKRQIEMCNNAKQLVQFPLDVSFENLGKLVNSIYADYLPFIPADESFVGFSSRRKGTTGGQVDKNGDYTSDIFISDVKNGNWSKIKSIGSSINTYYNEDICGMSPDGKTIFIYIDNMETTGIGDIFMTNVKGKVFQAPEMLGTNVNTNKHFETAACLAPGGNTLYFISDREGGKGEKDIYVSQKLPTGDWGIAVNLGENINTGFNEDYPYLSPDGRTLYFSSQGHNSMGGYDIFMSIWDEENSQWGPARNIGYPINNADDNLSFAIAKTGRDAYVAALRPEGFGDLDIYKVTFDQIDPKYTVFKGFLQNTDSSNIKGEALITINSKKTNELFGSYPIPETKNGKYLFYLPPGKYEMEIEAGGYNLYKQDILVQDKTAFKDEIVKNIIIEKIGEEKKAVKPTTVKPGTKPASKPSKPSTQKINKS